MNEASITTVTVHIMGREFKIKCPESKVAELKESAAYVDQKIQALIPDTNVASRENLLIIMALNIARELLSAKNNDNKTKEHLLQVSKSLRELKTKISEELDDK